MKPTAWPDPRVLLLAGACFACGGTMRPGSAPAENPPADEAILRRIKTVEWPRVYREQDVAGLDRLLHPSFSMIDDSGARSTKAEELAWVGKNRPSYASFRFEIERLNIYEGRFAVVDGTGVIEHDRCTPPRVTRYRSSNYFIKESDAWRAVSSHVSGVKESVPPAQECPAPAAAP